MSATLLWTNHGQAALRGLEAPNVPSLRPFGRKVVLGIGNILNRDEGVGVHSLNALKERLNGNAPDLEFIDGGVLGLGLLSIVESASHLLVLDAVLAGMPPGAIVEIYKSQMPLYTGMKLSEHQATFEEVLALAKFRDRLPEQLHLIGVQPADTTTGIELSANVRAALPRLVDRAISMLIHWQLIDPDSIEPYES
jgi:hydrogenase maturation protease